MTKYYLVYTKMYAMYSRAWRDVVVLRNTYAWRLKSNWRKNRTACHSQITLREFRRLWEGHKIVAATHVILATTKQARSCSTALSCLNSCWESLAPSLSHSQAVTQGLLWKDGQRHLYNLRVGRHSWSKACSIQIAILTSCELRHFIGCVQHIPPSCDSASIRH